MNTTTKAESEPLTEARPLIEYMEAGCKAPENWRIGTEHEKFAYDLDTLRPLDYESGVRPLLEGLTRFGWEPVLEAGKPIALTMPDLGSVTLEPGGQIELSGAPLETVHQTCAEVAQHLKQVKAVADEWNVGFMGLCFQPQWPAPGLPVARVEIYYAVDPDPRARFWRSPSVRRDGAAWIGALPGMDTQRPLVAVANVRYRRPRPAALPDR